MTFPLQQDNLLALYTTRVNIVNGHNSKLCSRKLFDILLCNSEVKTPPIMFYQRALFNQLVCAMLLILLKLIEDNDDSLMLCFLVK